ncbi:serine protease inhibitor dipetalogastin-like [Contarinia nasturtii]|uniref:serine protease inhibitor dipetalogastin-like n=1 Tax=Contarinia nasturtii TaxID=265458 RepID=UPI0012D43F96|nr:serine protease inhibitor dipetalogastin-like [Contarinia nasturtii]
MNYKIFFGILAIVISTINCAAQFNFDFNNDYDNNYNNDYNHDGFGVDCSSDNDPVCGGDDVTYQNQCWFNKARALRPSLYVAEYNVCRGSRCTCQNDNRLVCANDGVTYTDRCTLKCARNFHNSFQLKFVKYGYC